MNDYDRIEKAIRYLEDHFQEQPSLEELAKAAHLSPFHFQRLFQRWAGVSPKRFLQYLTTQQAKQRLLESRSVLDAAYDSGLSGPGRLHDLLVSVEAMTPGEYKTRGKGLKIFWGIHPTPFGKAFIAVTDRGVCGLSFLTAQNEKSVLKEFRKNWPFAIFLKAPSKTLSVIEKIFKKPEGKSARKLQVLLKGTPFQLKVWEALLKIPEGFVRAYQDVAREIGSPQASRAVGTAIGQNAVAYLIPCHRVIRETGVLGNYRWGSERKKAMLGWEGVQDQAKRSINSDRESAIQSGSKAFKSSR